MKTKFTKGEWSVRYTGDNAKVYYPHGFLTSANVIAIDESRDNNESWIEMMERTEPVRDKARDESDANMHLIAAAPEMYEMLASLNIAGGLGWDKHKRIDKLLAKARGES